MPIPFGSGSERTAGNQREPKRTMMKYRVRDAVRLLNIGQSTFYRAFKRNEKNLGESAGTDREGVYLTRDGMIFMATTLGKPVDTILAGEPAGTSENQERPAENQEAKPANNSNDNAEIINVLKENIGEMKRLLENQREQMAAILERQAEERRRSDTIIMTLTKQVEGAVKLIEEFRKPPVQLMDDRPKVVAIRPDLPKRVAKPIPSPEPSEPETVGQRLAREVLEMFQPWRKRAEWKAEHRKAA